MTSHIIFSVIETYEERCMFTLSLTFVCCWKAVLYDSLPEYLRGDTNHPDVHIVFMFTWHVVILLLVFYYSLYLIIRSEENLQRFAEQDTEDFEVQGKFYVQVFIYLE